MRCKIIITAICFGMSAALFAQSVYPGQHAGKMKKETVAPVQLESFDLNDVRLLPSRFRENMTRDSTWMGFHRCKPPVAQFPHQCRCICGA